MLARDSLDRRTDLKLDIIVSSLVEGLIIVEQEINNRRLLLI